MMAISLRFKSIFQVHEIGLTAYQFLYFRIVCKYYSFHLATFFVSF